jgi:GxxExxY protein
VKKAGDINELSRCVIGAAMEVHRRLGPGLLESVYQRCLAIEFDLRGIPARAEVCLPIRYRDRDITDDGYRMDFVVDDRLVVELKSVEIVQDVHKKQLLTYLKLSGCKLGLLINFNAPMLRDGITRIINGFDD